MMRKRARNEAVFLLAGAICLIAGDLHAMDRFAEVGKAAEEIAQQRILDPARLGQVLGGTFVLSHQAMPFHIVYDGRMSAGSPFRSCEARLPKSGDATAALIYCDVDEADDLTLKDVFARYGRNLPVDPPSPTAPPGQPAYVSVDRDRAQISFGFDLDTERLKRVVIDIQR